eukprot:8083028-Pyramimonas_sp.AAC.1
MLGSVCLKWGLVSRGGGGVCMCVFRGAAQTPNTMLMMTMISSFCCCWAMPRFQRVTSRGALTNPLPTWCAMLSSRSRILLLASKQ